MKNKRGISIVCVAFLMLLLSGCADVSSNVHECVTEDAYGFWSGLWHGIIVIFSWTGSLFSDDIAIYAYNNNGGWYDFGFILGISGIAGEATRATSKRY